jgi:hypothetical protein
VEVARADAGTRVKRSEGKNNLDSKSKSLWCVGRKLSGKGSTGSVRRVKEGQMGGTRQSRGSNHARKSEEVIHCG